MNRTIGIVLLSGGLDSATVAAIARRDGYCLHGITFAYGQRHEIELQCARRLAEFFGIGDHIVIDIPSRIFSSALIRGSAMEVPKHREPLEERSIPATYVPARNTLFLAYALAYAESVSAGAIFIGANAVDFSGYPDCRPEFFSAFQTVADRGTRAGVDGDGIRIMTPIIDMKKSEIIMLGTQLGVDYSLTHSCYDPTAAGLACGACDSCILRRRGFMEAGVPDPTRYGTG
ncbi:MAG: 7-cyano-7-deazaguanine synthase QueC [Spirochaetes bacterium]|nr:7-cyano-7-deazaguanine synthase QueC [Spirochaetota bacterium]